jgi:hypothetical protein
MQQHGLLAAHLADDVRGQQVLALGVLGHGLVAAAGVGRPAALCDVLGAR